MFRFASHNLLACRRTIQSALGWGESPQGLLPLLGASLLSPADSPVGRNVAAHVLSGARNEKEHLTVARCGTAGVAQHWSNHSNQEYFLIWTP